MNRKVYVGSNSKIKLAAVRAALSQVFPNLEFDVIGIEVESQVNFQPSNMKEILTGAKNRLEALQGHPLTGDASLFITIENGLIYKDGHFYDVGVVVVSDNHTSLVGTTEGVQIPESAVIEALHAGFDTTTYADVMAGKYGNHKIAKDPHLFLTGISRQAYLQTTIAEVLSANR